MMQYLSMFIFYFRRSPFFKLNKAKKLENLFKVDYSLSDIPLNHSSLDERYKLKKRHLSKNSVSKPIGKDISFNFYLNESKKNSKINDKSMTFENNQKIKKQLHLSPRTRVKSSLNLDDSKNKNEISRKKPLKIIPFSSDRLRNSEMIFILNKNPGVGLYNSISPYYGK